MSNVECVKSSVFSMKKVLLNKQLLKLTKITKPVLRLLARKRRPNAITPSTCNYECEQNEVNESSIFQVDFKFHEEEYDNFKNERTESDENDLNEALERRLQDSVNEVDTERFGVAVSEEIVLPVITGTYFAVPACYLETVPGQFTWIPLPAPDSDVVKHGDCRPLSLCQSPQQQVPCC